ncbi:MAG: DUF302 domain-containing protein [Cyclobacteriaceae bacterium]
MLSPKYIISGLLLTLVFTVNAQNLTIYRSSMSVEETTEKLVNVINEQNLVYFETVIHDEIAKDRNFELPPTRVVLFEDPDLTTRLIKCNQTTALEMPLKMLVWEENQDVYIGFVDPKLMSKRFLLQGCDEVLEDLARMMVKLANTVIRSS